MKKQWEKKEKRDAGDFGGKRTPRSGGMWFAKGDSKSDKYLIENKTTAKESFSIKAHIWQKIEKEALLSHRAPMLSIEFGKDKIELIIMNKDDFLTLDI